MQTRNGDTCKVPPLPLEEKVEEGKKQSKSKAVVPSDWQVCEVPENRQDSSSWFIKIAEDMILVTAAPVDLVSKSFERTLPTTQSSVYQSRFPGKSCARVRSSKYTTVL